MRRRVILILSAIAALPAAAQMSITTIGATDANACFRNASDSFSNEVSACDIALRDATLTRRDHNATLVNRGIIFNRTGEYAAALEDFDQALARNPELAEAYLNRGNAYFLMRNINAAISDYEESLEKGIKKQHVAWYNIGLAYDALKDTKKAREAYERAVQIKPEFTLAQRKLAQKNSPQ